MARVRFVGPEDLCEVFAHVFEKGQWKERHTLERDELDRLANNPTFEVEGHAPDAAAMIDPEPEARPAA